MVPRGKLRYAVGERGKHSTRARAPDRNRNRRRTRLEQQQERRQKSQSNPWNPCRLGRLEALSWAEGNPCLKISQDSTKISDDTEVIPPKRKQPENSRPLAAPYGYL